jgi:hypothetical protein
VRDSDPSLYSPYISHLWIEFILDASPCWLVYDEGMIVYDSGGSLIMLSSAPFKLNFKYLNFKFGFEIKVIG